MLFYSYFCERMYYWGHSQVPWEASWIIVFAAGAMTDKSLHRTTRESVSRRLEMQRQVDEISAVQCRKRELVETSHT